MQNVRYEKMMSSTNRNTMKILSLASLLITSTAYESLEIFDGANIYPTDRDNRLLQSKTGKEAKVPKCDPTA